jgi:hypothetical protein
MGDADGDGGYMVMFDLEDLEGARDARREIWRAPASARRGWA